MAIPYTYEELIGIKNDVPLICEWCSTTFYRPSKEIRSAIKYGNSRGKFCSKACGYKSYSKSVMEPCAQCSIIIEVKPSERIKTKSGRMFCSSSCAATYNNTHKTKGNRKSKLEVYLESKLPGLYPDLEFHFNRKDAVNSELDVYIPALKLAFELNGIYHYEPIHGTKKLAQIQNNDGRKFQACLEQGIELCIIDTSNLSYSIERNQLPYLDMVKKIIEAKNSNNT